MKTIAILIVGVVLIGTTVLFWQKTEKQSAAIAALQQQTSEVETLRTQNAELKKYQDQSAELSIAKQNQRELVKLRGEVATLRTEKQKLTAELQQTQSSLSYIRQNIPAPPSPPPGQIGGSYALSDPEAVRAACINNLRLIDGAMQQWALENKKTGEDIPTKEDLEPYLGGKDHPWNWTCPGGGSYELGAVKFPPRCSLPGHVLPQ